MPRNYLTGTEAREKLMEGVYAVRDAVAPTYGAKGKDGILEAFEQPYSIVTNDGISIAERVKCDDVYENMGANLIKEAISRANKESGDGSTTTCILTAAILEEGQKYMDSNEDIRASLNECLPVVLESLDKQARQITPEEVEKVATISSQSEEMGKMLGEIFSKIGKDGIVDWENSYTPDTHYTIREGVELKNVTFVANWMPNANAKGDVSNPLEGDRVVMKNPHILITQEKITGADNLEPYLRALSNRGIKELVVFFDEIDPIALQTLAMTYLQGKFKVILLKAPTLWKDWVYEDFALMTGATIIRPESGASWKTPSESYLGTCEKLIARRTGTDIIGGKDISEHIKRLEANAHNNPENLVRSGWLNSKAAMIKLGARSEVELSYKRLKLEDAANACKQALKYGIVAGGGVALNHVTELLPDTTGANILKIALSKPFQQIQINAGRSLVEMNGSILGIDVKKGEVVDMFEAGIVDPVSIPKNAISAAISVAGQVLNADVVIPLDRPTQTYA